MIEIQHKIGVDEPARDTRILRVFTVEKYKKLFTSNSIWFSSIDLLRQECDSLERTIPKGFFDRMTLHQKEMYKTVNKAKDDTYKSFISCWSQVECGELWDKYDKFHNGIAIYSSVGAMLNALNPQTTLSTTIQYINLDDTSRHYDLPWVLFEEQNEFVGSIKMSLRLKESFKSGDYIDDNEIRFIMFDKNNDSEGIGISVNLDSIIETIVIDPYASKEVRQNIMTFLDAYPKMKCKIQEREIRDA